MFVCLVSKCLVASREGPIAANITLLKVRATDERMPLLVADLRTLAAELVDPLRRLDRASLRAI